MIKASATSKTKHPRKQPIQVFLVDDHSVVRQGTRDILNQHENINVVDEADSATTFWQILPLIKPDIILLDINLPDETGLQILEKLKESTSTKDPSNFKVIMFSAHTEWQYINRAIKLKADGFISKTVEAKELQNLIITTIQTSNSTPTYSKDIAGIIQHYAQQNTNQKLTGREMEILLELAQGKTNQEISKSLVVAVKTVDTHVGNLIKKLQVKNRTQLISKAYEEGLL